MLFYDGSASKRDVTITVIINYINIKTKAYNKSTKVIIIIKNILY